MTKVIDIAAGRTADRQPAPDDHRTRQKYDDVAELLADALRVVTDLERPGQLVVPVTEIEFTIRRLRALITGAERRLTDPAPQHQEKQ